MIQLCPLYLKKFKTILFSSYFSFICIDCSIGTGISVIQFKCILDFSYYCQQKAFIHQVNTLRHPCVLRFLACLDSKRNCHYRFFYQSTPKTLVLLYGKKLMLVTGAFFSFNLEAKS